MTKPRVLFLLIGLSCIQASHSEPLFTQKGTDPSFEKLMKGGKLKDGGISKDGVSGSKVNVDNRRVEITPNAKRPIPREIKLHTLGNSAIPRGDFGKWTRWYQEDGSTQVFRLFKGDEVHLDGKKVGAGTYARPAGKTNFRWGMYLGSSAVTRDAMIFVSGATVDGKEKD